MRIKYGTRLIQIFQSSNVSSYEPTEWDGEKHYLVWLYFWGIADFVKLMEGFGVDFSEGGYDVNLQRDGVCVDLNDLYLYDIDLDKVFDMEED